MQWSQVARNPEGPSRNRCGLVDRNRGLLVKAVSLVMPV